MGLKGRDFLGAVLREPGFRGSGFRGLGPRVLATRDGARVLETKVFSILVMG